LLSSVLVGTRSMTSSMSFQLMATMRVTLLLKDQVVEKSSNNRSLEHVFKPTMFCFWARDGSFCITSMVLSTFLYPKGKQFVKLQHSHPSWNSPPAQQSL
jgi:hypothetical protein